MIDPDGTIPIGHAHCLFSHVYLTKEERRLKAISRSDLLAPIATVPETPGRINPSLARSSLDYQFQATSGSVIELERRPARYVWRGGFNLKLRAARRRMEIDHERILVSVWNPSVVDPLVMISVGLTLTNLDGPEAILAVTKGFEGRPTADQAQVFTLPGNEAPFQSARDLIEHCARELGILGESRTPDKVAEPRFLPLRIVEVNGLPSAMSAGVLHSLAEHRSGTDGHAPDLRALYGLVTGDEGWRYASSELVERTLARGWGSREFFWVTALGEGVLLVNDKPRTYGEDADIFFRRWLGMQEPYYAANFDVAGLDHGILYNAERVVNIAVRAEDVMVELKDMIDTFSRQRTRGLFPTATEIKKMIRRQRTRGTTVANKPSRVFGKLHSVRLKLFECRETAGRTRIAELGKLYHKLEDAMGLNPRLETLDIYASWLDDEVFAAQTIILAQLSFIVSILALIVAAIALLRS
jgi:hypothetical protein